MANINNVTNIKIKEQGKTYGSIQLDFTTAKTDFAAGFKNYNNNNIDPNKPPGTGKPPAKFHKERQYDVEYHGLKQDGAPVDFPAVAASAGKLISNPSVAALMSVNGNFGLELSKLVNIPSEAFKAFISFLGQLNTFYDATLNNDGFKN
jgi:hypothetical protein